MFLNTKMVLRTSKWCGDYTYICTVIYIIDWSVNTAFAFICTMNYITTECVISKRYINLINITMMLRLYIHLYCNIHHYLNPQRPPGASRGLQGLPRASKALQGLPGMSKEIFRKLGFLRNLKSFLGADLMRVKIKCLFLSLFYLASFFQRAIKTVFPVGVTREFIF